MHHVGVALDGEEFFSVNGTVFTDAAEIVAPQIDEHDVLGTFLFAGEHFAFKTLIFGFIFPAPPRSTNGPIKNIAALNLDEHFGGTANHADIVHLQVERIWGWIQRAESAGN